MQPQADAAGGPRARAVGAVEGLRQARQVGLGHARAVVAHHDRQAAVGAHPQIHLGRAGRVLAVPQGVVQQIAQQQAHARPVQRPGRRQPCIEAHDDALGAGVTCAQVLDRLVRQRTQVHRLTVQHGVGTGQAFALQQVGHQRGHLLQVALQGLARRAVLVGLGQQGQVQPRPGQRAAQLVADGQQQPALGLEHLFDVRRHRVDRLGELVEFIGPRGVTHRDRRVESPTPEATHPGADRVQRTQQPANRDVGAQRDEQQRPHRPDEGPLAALEHRLVDAVDDAVPVGGLARQQGGPARVDLVTAPMPAVGWRVRGPMHDGALDPHGDRQALRHRAGALDARRPGRARVRAAGRERRRDLGGDAVDVVLEQGLRRLAPAHPQGLLRRQREHQRQCRGQGQEQQHQPELDRACRPAAPGGYHRRGGGHRWRVGCGGRVRRRHRGSSRVQLVAAARSVCLTARAGVAGPARSRHCAAS